MSFIHIQIKFIVYQASLEKEAQLDSAMAHSFTFTWAENVNNRLTDDFH